MGIVAVFLTACVASLFTNGMLVWLWVMFEAIFPEHKEDIRDKLHPFLDRSEDK